MTEDLKQLTENKENMKSKAFINLLIWLFISGLILALLQDQFCK